MQHEQHLGLLIARIVVDDGAVALVSRCSEIHSLMK
jgi:hypothetical protein